MALEARISKAVMAGTAPSAIGLVQIYRNTVWRAWLEAMKHQYPSAVAALGDGMAEAVIRAYLERYPPSSPVLLDIGESFPRFIASQFSGRPLLAHIARADWLWRSAHVAADAKHIGPSDWVALTRDPHQPLRLHPACYWLCLDQAQMRQGDGDLAAAWASARPTQASLSGYGLLFGRPSGAVVVVAIDAAEGAFLDALQQKEALMPALESVLQQHQTLDFNALGEKLMTVGALRQDPP